MTPTSEKLKVVPNQLLLQTGAVFRFSRVQRV
jgi:hypothetical protein